MTYCCLPLHNMDDPRPPILLALRGDYASPDNVEISQLFVGGYEAMTVFVQGSELNDNPDTHFLILVRAGIVGDRRFSVDDRQRRTRYGLLPLVLATDKGGKPPLLGRVGVVNLGVCLLLSRLGVWDR